MKKIGFIGLGIMGKPMVRNLLKAGQDVTVFDRDSKSTDIMVSEGAKTASTAEIGEICDVIFLSLPNGKIVSSVIFGDNGLTSKIKKGAIIVDTSSILPTEAQKISKDIKQFGAEYIDSPVSGGEPKAIDGTLAVMCGGEKDAYEKVKPILLMIGASTVLVGGSGSGCVTKLANQIIVNNTIAAISEAFVLAAKAGAKPLKVYEAIKGGLAGSTVLDAKVPMIAERNFVPGGKIAINHKDIKNVIDAAHALDVPVPITSQLFEIFQALKVQGLMDEDHAAIVKYFERLANVEVKA
jgi:2-hydroxy-3-oxopropionate reductase